MITSLREQVEAMPPADAVEYLMEVIETSRPEHHPAVLQGLVEHGFTLQQARILAALKAVAPRVMTKDGLCRRISARDEIPSEGVLRVQVRRARHRLKALGWSIAICTDWGLGYHLDCAPGFQFKGEENAC